MFKLYLLWYSNYFDNPYYHTYTTGIYHILINDDKASKNNEWCDTLDPACFTHLFSDGTDKCLALFKSITNDENSFIVRLAKTVIGLRIEDWDSATIEAFGKKLTQYQTTAESYHTESTQRNTEQASNDQVTFVDADGSATTKSFERVESTKRGKLLFNQITQSLESMGHSITEQEKRQILMDVLKSAAAKNASRVCG